MPTLTADERAALLVELADLTHLDDEKRAELATCIQQAPELLPGIVANYADQDWAAPSTPAGQRFLEIVSALGGVGGAVGNVVGAAAGVKGL